MLTTFGIVKSCLSRNQTESREQGPPLNSFQGLGAWDPQEATETFYFLPCLKLLPTCGPYTTCLAKVMLKKSYACRARYTVSAQ